MTFYHLDTKLDLKSVDDRGSFQGYASVYGVVDRDGDVVESGAFAKSLGERMPKLLVHHDARLVAGRWLAATDDGTGLLMEGQFNLKTQIGTETYEQVKSGDLDGLSIGFITRAASRDEETGVRTITEADLWETSVVTFPANDAATITAVKALAGMERPAALADLETITTLKSLEALLRDAAGLTRNEAKRVAARFYPKAFADARDARGEMAEISRLLKSSLSLLKGQEK